MTVVPHHHPTVCEPISGPTTLVLNSEPIATPAGASDAMQQTTSRAIAPRTAPNRSALHRAPSKRSILPQAAVQRAASNVIPFPSQPRSDYARLDTLLAARRWREANLETLSLLLGAAKSQRNFCIRVDEIARVPASTLRLLDRLWLNHSYGHFGFSVQARAFAALGGSAEYAREAWQACGDRLGWRREERWLTYAQLDFSLDAAAGHLPRIDPLGNYYPGVAYVWLLSAIAQQLFADERPNQTRGRSAAS